VMNQVHPTRNNSLFSGTWVNGSLTPASSAEREGGGINWCSLPYTPLSSIPLKTYSWQSWLQDDGSGSMFGQTPQSLLDWMKCYNTSVPAEEIAKGNSAYDCRVDDRRMGGYVSGFTLYKSAGEKRVGTGMMMKGMVLGGVGYLAMSLI
jgi:hypothetical protein